MRTAERCAGNDENCVLVSKASQEVKQEMDP